MAKFVFMNLRERADALRRGGVDWAIDLHEALDAVDDLASADEALEEIGEIAGMDRPDASNLEAITSAVTVLAEERDAGALEVKRLNRVILALQEEQRRLVAFMTARGLVPPPPASVTRPVVPERTLPRGRPGETLAQRINRAFVDDDDVPF